MREIKRISSALRLQVMNTLLRRLLVHLLLTVVAYTIYQGMNHLVILIDQQGRYYSSQSYAPIGGGLLVYLVYVAYELFQYFSNSSKS